MTKLIKFFTLTVAGCLMLAACDTDEPKSSGNSGSSTTTTKPEVRPEIAKVSATTTTSDFTVTFRVKSVDFPNVTMKYSRESSKTSTPSLNKTSSPTCHNIVKSGSYSWYYYKTTHTGFNGGNYIYYQISASNSKGSDKSSVSYCIIKR